MIIAATDTETVRYGRPWSIQIADPYLPKGHMHFCDNPEEMGHVGELLQDSDTLTVLHNAKYDLRILKSVGITPANAECTMQMAYLLGEPRLSLKVLAYRIAGIDMRTYAEVTAEATQEKALAYLNTALEMTWPDPDPYMDTDKDGNLKVHWPKNIKGKIATMLKKASVDPDFNLYDKWHTMDPAGGRSQVEEAMGPLERAYLDEVDIGVAMEYALLDAEATYAIYGYLHDEIERYDLQEMLELDMECLSMAVEMEDNGILLDQGELEALGRDLDRLAEDTQTDINFIAGRYVNPRSPKQVVALLQDEGIFTDLDTNTDSSTMDQYKEYTLVNKIQDYRAYAKLKSTYVKGLAKAIQSDGKIHTSISTTRTGTGRWASSKPNMQNIPVRTELGRRIRKAFVSERNRS